MREGEQGCEWTKYSVERSSLSKAPTSSTVDKDLTLNGPVSVSE